MTFTKEDFLQAGYKEYQVPYYEAEWADIFLQKQVKDDVGTRYFINILIVEETELLKSRFYAEGCFENDMSLWITLSHFRSIRELENTFETIWLAFEGEYYEKKY